MQSENTRTATIIGGSYIEVCDLYDGKPQLKGSGIRALEVFLELGWNGLLSFYYELELDKKLDEANTGGEPILSTTIVTKNKIFVPVMPQLYDYFKKSQQEELSFMVNYTNVH